MKTLSFFALRFVLVFVLLASPWQGVRTLTGAAFRLHIRLVASTLFSRQSIRVEAFSNPQYPAIDTVVVLPDQPRPGRPGTPAEAKIPFDSLSQGWIPLAMLTALGLVTPAPWSKRLKLLLAGSLAILTLESAAIFVSIAFNLTTDATPAWPRVPLMCANRLLVENIWFSFVPPFLFWAGWLAGSGCWKQLKERLTGR